MGKISDERLVEELRERGHTEAANALERKLTARRAVERRREAGVPYEFNPREKMRRPGTYRPGREVREERVAGRSTSRDTGGGGDDDE